MTPVSIFQLPHNHRDALYEDEATEDESFPRSALPYSDLPIPMPESVMVIVDQDLNPLAIDVLGEAGGRIRKKDVQQVWRGIQQFNADCDAEEGWFRALKLGFRR